MLEYLIGVIIGFIFWIIFFSIRKDLRKPMVWSGLMYVVFTSGIFWLSWIISKFIFIGNPITPDYWNPNTLFDLGRITNGFAIEDILFMFVIGGLVSFLYEYLFNKRIRLKKTYKPHIRAVIFGYVIAIIIQLIFKPNIFYILLISASLGALILWIERKDLIKHSILGAFISIVIYVILFSIFNAIFPNFILNNYNLNALLGIYIFKIPVEEYFYAFSLGLLWAPLYEYAHGETNTDIRE